MKKRCMPCGGSGRVMGGGMMMMDCDNCDGYGKVTVVDDEIDYLVMKQTEGYQKAKKRLQASNENLSDEEAEQLLDEAFEKEKPITRKKRNGKEENR